MAVIFSTGFGAYAATEEVFVNSDVEAKKVIPLLEANGTNVYLKNGSFRDYGSIFISITQDEYIPSRRVLHTRLKPSSSSDSCLFGIRCGNKESVEKGIIAGFTFKISNSSTAPAVGATLGYTYGICVSSIYSEKKNTPSRVYINDPNDIIFAIVNGKRTGADDGPNYPLVLCDANDTTPPSNPSHSFKGSTIHHAEVVIERSKRVRVYIDGDLVSDREYKGGDIERILKGITISSFWGTYASYNTLPDTSIDIGNIYVLEMDDVHSERLGPSTRVVDYAPAADIKAELKNTNSSAKGNYETASQNINDQASSLTASGESPVSDIYKVSESIGRDAAKIYGASVRVTGINPSNEKSVLKPVVKVNNNEFIGSGVDVLSTLSTVTLDCSKNPTTEKVWSVNDIINSGIGFESLKDDN